MVEEHIVLEGDVTAVDTRTPLTGFFGDTAETQIPENVERIKEIRTTVVSDGKVLGASTFAIRLEGKGINNSPQDINIGGIGGQLVTSNNVYSRVETTKVNIPVTSGSKFTVSAYSNFDTGTATVEVELVLD
jgi:hypothetical protein